MWNRCAPDWERGEGGVSDMLCDDYGASQLCTDASPLAGGCGDVVWGESCRAQVGQIDMMTAGYCKASRWFGSRLSTRAWVIP